MRVLKAHPLGVNPLRAVEPSTHVASAWEIGDSALDMFPSAAPRTCSRDGRDTR